MRIAFNLLFLLILATSCKDQETIGDNNSKTADEVSFKGDYIHIGDAAVLSTEDEIYAVRIDDKSGKLDEKGKQFMKTPYDMVQVVITGELIPNPRKAETGEGWDQMIVIDKIIEVRKAKSSAVMQTPAQEQEDN
jgi:hypothetical protein